MYACWHKQIFNFYASRCILYMHKMTLEMCLRKWQKLVFLTKWFKGWTDWKDGKKISILIHILVLNDKNDSWKDPTFQISRHVTGMPSLLTLWLNIVTYKNHAQEPCNQITKKAPLPNSYLFNMFMTLGWVHSKLSQCACSPWTMGWAPLSSRKQNFF